MNIIIILNISQKKKGLHLLYHIKLLLNNIGITIFLYILFTLLVD